MSSPQIDQSIGEPAHSWLRSVLGDYQLQSAHRIGSDRTGVWKISSSGENFFFKVHQNRLRWSGEVFAYQHWVSAYQPYIPQLVALFDQDNWHGLLVTALPGRPLKECNFDEAIVLEVYRQAGRICKELSDQPAGTEFGFVDEQGVAIDYQGEALGKRATDPVAFIGDTLVEWLDQARALKALEADEVAQVEQALASIETFRYEAPTLVNTDYTSNNWLVDQDGKLVGIIDFEHLFRNVLADAFTRLLMAHYTPGAMAFLEGYGSNPLATRVLQARILCVRHALYFVMDGTEVKNTIWIERGRKIFRQVDEIVAPFA